MSLRVYNTLTRTKEPFETLAEGQVRMYVCGPTVYDRAHIGHAMSSIVFDVIRRYLEYRGFQVRYVMNYTDVDDKLIMRARELGVDARELAQRYVEQYDQHLQDLNIVPPSVKPRVSEEIETIVEMVQGLLEKGHAYRVDGDVYFDVTRDPEYGKLSGRKLEEMQAGARLEIDERKRNPADFALWKSAKPGEPSWGSPWGPGRPGWHIECSAMSLRYLGQQIDIHGGGNDLIFPHHENEIAQSESLSGRPFARYWIHNGMMQLRGETMSKSTGNVLPIEDFLADYEADVLRLVVLNSHYRSPLAFNRTIADSAAQGLERLRAALKPAEGSGADEAGRAEGTLTEADLGEPFDPSAPLRVHGLGAVSPSTSLRAVSLPNRNLEPLVQAVESAQADFVAAMDDDFNAPRALSSLYELVRSINQARDSGVGQPVLEGPQAKLRELANVLGLQLVPAALPDHAGLIDLMIEIREELRAARQWELADRIRVRLAEQGVQLEDGKHGTSWRYG